MSKSRFGRADRTKNRTSEGLTLLGEDGATELSEHTDYLYCPVCEIHVACLRIPSGGWEVDCPGCRGECVLCDCHLKRFCFGSREVFPPFESSSR